MPFRIYVLALCGELERLRIRRKFVVSGFELGGLHCTMGRLTVCMQLQVVENMIVFDDSGKQIDDMEESESKVEEDAKRKMFKQHLFIG